MGVTEVSKSGREERKEPLEGRVYVNGSDLTDLWMAGPGRVPRGVGGQRRRGSLRLPLRRPGEELHAEGQAPLPVPRPVTAPPGGDPREGGTPRAPSASLCAHVAADGGERARAVPCPFLGAASLRRTSMSVFVCLCFFLSLVTSPAPPPSQPPPPRRSDRVTDITMVMKELFFEGAGDMFNLKHYPGLRSADDYGRASSSMGFKNQVFRAASLTFSALHSLLCARGRPPSAPGEGWQKRELEKERENLFVCSACDSARRFSTALKPLSFQHSNSRLVVPPLPATGRLRRHIPPLSLDVWSLSLSSRAHRPRRTGCSSGAKNCTSL